MSQSNHAMNDMLGVAHYYQLGGISHCNASLNNVVSITVTSIVTVTVIVNVTVTSTAATTATAIVIEL